MGEVRSTLESKPQTNPKNPLDAIAEAKDKAFDLLGKKIRDRDTEGEAARVANEASIARIQGAIDHLKAAEADLKGY